MINRVVGIGELIEAYCPIARLSDDADTYFYQMLPFEDNRFDAIVCTVSVEYLIQPQELFHEALRVLKPGGRFIITFSNRWALRVHIPLRSPSLSGWGRR